MPDDHDELLAVVAEWLTVRDNPPIDQYEEDGALLHRLASALRASEQARDEYKREWESACERDRAANHRAAEAEARAERAETALRLVRCEGCGATWVDHAGERSDD